MDGLSKLLLYATLCGTGFVVALFLLSFGRFGPMFVVILPLGGMVMRSLTGDDPVAGSAPTNCGECGSPNSPERDRCSYCDAPLAGDHASDP